MSAVLRLQPTNAGRRQSARAIPLLADQVKVPFRCSDDLYHVAPLLGKTLQGHVSQMTLALAQNVAAVDEYVNLYDPRMGADELLQMEEERPLGDTTLCGKARICRGDGGPN